jgi:hypothetical protein
MKISHIDKYFLFIAVCIYLITACTLPFLEDKIPPQVPKDLEQSLAKIFEHMSDDTTQVLEENIANLQLWFQDRSNLEQAREGLLIGGLPQSAVEDLETKSSNLKGITVATKTTQCPEGIAGLITWDKFGDILVAEDPALEYERSFDKDSNCFWDHSCTQINASSNVKSQWGGLVDMTTEYIIEFRWIKINKDWVFLHRYWLKKNAKNEGWGLNMKANYYLGLTFFDGARKVKEISNTFRNASNGAFGVAGDTIKKIQETLAAEGSLRIHANWFDIDLGKVENALSQEQVINQLIQAQINDSQRHDVLLSKHEVPGECAIMMVDQEAGEMAGEIAGEIAGEMAGEMSDIILDLTRNSADSISGVWLLNAKLSNGIPLKLKTQIQYKKVNNPAMNQASATIRGILQRENDPLDAMPLTSFVAEVQSDGTFVIDLPQLSLDVGIVVEGDLFFNATIFQTEDLDRAHWCGKASGMISKPLTLDLQGSTFYAWPIDEEGDLPDPLPAGCPAL